VCVRNIIYLRVANSIESYTHNMSIAAVDCTGLGYYNDDRGSGLTIFMFQRTDGNREHISFVLRSKKPEGPEKNI
jgi:hypothetical protein